PAVALDDLFTDRQPDPRARILIMGVQASENVEDTLRLLRGNTNAVIPHREPPLMPVTLSPHVDPGRGRVTKLEGIFEQVAEHQDYLRPGCPYRRQGIMGDDGRTGADLGLQGVEGFSVDSLTVGCGEGLRGSLDLHVVEQVFQLGVRTGRAFEDIVN